MPRRPSAAAAATDEEDWVNGTSSQAAASSQTPASQRKPKVHLDEALRDKKVTNIVRFCLFKHSRGEIIKYSDFSDETVAGRIGSLMGVLFKDAQQILRTTFGFELVELPTSEKAKDGPAALKEMKQPSLGSTGQKTYVLRSVYKGEDISTMPWSEDVEYQGLVMVILSYIYMTKQEVSEAQLQEFLGKFGIAKGRRHNIFGAYDDIEKRLIADKFLMRFKRVRDDRDVFVYRWGTRARATINEKAILRFLGEVYGKDPTEWMRKLALPLDDEDEEGHAEEQP